MSYKVEYLPLALADLKDAVAHISDELGMPKAARELVGTIIGDGVFVRFPVFAFGLYSCQAIET